MRPVATYVFVDLETTSLPFEDNNRSKITELSLVAVKRAHVLDTRPGAAPRVQHKLTLCINPQKRIHDSATKVTGLCNELLEYEPTFNMQIFNLIDTFLNVLPKPVCLIAQNGHNFDFPILKNHFEKLKVKLSPGILCADSLHAFYDIETSNDSNSSLKNVEINKNIKQGSKDTPCDGKQCSENQPIQSNTLEMSKTTSQITADQTKDDLTNELYQETNIKDEIDNYNASSSLQAINETTPKQKKVTCKQITKPKLRRKLFWNNNKKPSDSYKLKDVYMRVLNRQAVDCHRAENDCILTLEVAVAMNNAFVEWVDKNHCPFSDIKPMTIGVPLGE